MKDKDFNAFYIRFHLERECPGAKGVLSKSKGCYSAAELGKAPTNAGCKKCWRKYIEQQDPVDTGEVQGELF